MLTTADQVIAAIKAVRDQKRHWGGVKVGQHWFRSDQVATGEYVALAMLGAGKPATTVLRAGWRTMDGATVDMTPALVNQILAAGFAQIAAIDDVAQAHIASVGATEDPGSYDLGAGWPATYQ